ncbi:amino acid ABC transporter substrate-binding protein [Propionivibrio soli]|uniref:amino acid ABC transporter substrate-binding protein n=1 Tax=Propionivibrio soli TaxID=2976531 RepID=UPI0021E7817F|nr:amino acid ABC transporter substrate-binding protein [Propionivibrio soli]
MSATRVMLRCKNKTGLNPARLFCLGVLLLSSAIASAGPTLDRIAKTGAVTIGYRDSSPPFSYLDENNRPIGYSIDICLKVVDAMKRELKRSDLTVKYVPVSSSSRMKAVASGEADIECGSTTSSAERRKEVAFTIPTFLAVTRFLTRADSGIKSMFDLNGKTVVTTKGTSSEKLFNDLNEGRGLGAKLVLAKDHNESFSFVEGGKADAFIMDDVLLYSLRAASKNPNNYSITRDTLTVEPLAMMMSKDDPAFKKVVDTEVARIITQGEINAIYRKWFESPIPPKQINLQLQMGHLLRDSFKAPTDWVPN